MGCLVIYRQRRSIRNIQCKNNCVAYLIMWQAVDAIFSLKCVLCKNKKKKKRQAKNVWADDCKRIRRIFFNIHTHTHTPRVTSLKIFYLFFSWFSPVYWIAIAYCCAAKLEFEWKKHKTHSTLTHTHTMTKRKEAMQEKQKAQISENKRKPNKQSCFIKTVRTAPGDIRMRARIHFGPIYHVMFHTYVHITTRSQHVCSLNVNTT